MQRLDAALVQRGLVPSRQRAKELIAEGQVQVNGTCRMKPAYGVTETDRLEVLGKQLPFVGRGGLKLEYAVQQLRLNLEGQVCMDIGASTGGFTDCMLQHGAAKVYAVDVGHGQLAEKLRQNPRVISWEGTDIRHVTPADLAEPVTFFSVDVSFISLHLVLPAAAALLEPGGRAVILIKPQFEAGRENIGKNGLVLSESVHLRVLEEMLTLFASLHFSLQLLCPSPITGGSGNVEYLAAVEQSAQPGVCPDLRALVTQALGAHRKGERRRGLQ